MLEHLGKNQTILQKKEMTHLSWNKTLWKLTILITWKKKLMKRFKKKKKKRREIAEKEKQITKTIDNNKKKQKNCLRQH